MPVATTTTTTATSRSEIHEKMEREIQQSKQELFISPFSPTASRSLSPSNSNVSSTDETHNNSSAMFGQDNSSSGV